MKNPTHATVSATLRRLSRHSGGFDASRYFRGSSDLRFYNVGMGRVRSLARAIHSQHREQWTVEDAMRLADELMEDRWLETKAVGVELVGRYRRSFTAQLLPRWKRWLARDLAANWATTDLICGVLIGPLLAARPPLASSMPGWTRHRNLWVRRAAAVGLLPAIRRGLALDRAYQVAAALHPDPEDLIQKAAGWLLREAGKQDPARLERYLLANGPAIPRVTVRYAIEKFSAARRHRLLASTRSRE